VQRTNIHTVYVSGIGQNRENERNMIFGKNEGQGKIRLESGENSTIIRLFFCVKVFF
jgi:hypothetical protein